MTEDEIYDKCSEVWASKNTWNLTYEDLIRISYVRGDNGNGLDDKPEDTVYTSPEGYILTRCSCSRLMLDWFGFVAGFVESWKIFRS